jgi:hypothetical protein
MMGKLVQIGVIPSDIFLLTEELNRHQKLREDAIRMSVIPFFMDMDDWKLVHGREVS